MKRIVPALLIGLVLIGGVAFFALSTDERIEVNAMTGAVRTKTRYAYVFNSEWKVRSTWIGESAVRQGISTANGWQYLSVVSKRLFYMAHASGRAPASYPVRAIDPEALNLTNSEEIDRFTRDFITADEAKRKQMLSIP
ncbi:MAG: hypothetical protein V4640_15305 [Verrucomicrobiota bacterium]